MHQDAKGQGREGSSTSSTQKYHGSVQESRRTCQVVVWKWANTCKGLSALLLPNFFLLDVYYNVLHFKNWLLQWTLLTSELGSTLQRLLFVVNIKPTRLCSNQPLLSSPSSPYFAIFQPWLLHFLHHIMYEDRYFKNSSYCRYTNMVISTFVCFILKVQRPKLALLCQIYISVLNMNVICWGVRL